MASKTVLLFTLLATVYADYLSTPAPLAYSTPSSYHAPTVSYTAAPPAVTSQSANIIRSPGNLGQVSTFTKTIDTPYSSVSKSDVRVSNPGYTTYTAPHKAVGYHVTPAPVHELSSPVHTYPAVYRSSPYHQPSVVAPIHTPYQSPLTAPAVYQHPHLPTYQHSAPTYQHSPVLAYQHTPAALYQHSLSAPTYQYSAPTYQHSAPTYQHSSAPVYHTPASSYPYNYPVTAPAGHPLLGVAYSHAPSVSHMSFDGHGINYTY